MYKIEIHYHDQAKSDLFNSATLEGALDLARSSLLLPIVDHVIVSSKSLSLVLD